MNFHFKQLMNEFNKNDYLLAARFFRKHIKRQIKSDFYLICWWIRFIHIWWCSDRQPERVTENWAFCLKSSFSVVLFLLSFVHIFFQFFSFVCSSHGRRATCTFSQSTIHFFHPWNLHKIDFFTVEEKIESFNDFFTSLRRLTWLRVFLQPLKKCNFCESLSFFSHQ